MNDERRPDERPLAWSQVPDGDPRSRHPGPDPGARRRPADDAQRPRHPQSIQRRPGYQPPQQPRRSAQPPHGQQPQATRIERSPQAAQQPAPPRNEWAPRQTPEPLPPESHRAVGERGRASGRRSGGRVPPPPRPPRRGGPRVRRGAAPQPQREVRHKRRIRPLRVLSALIVGLLVAVVAGTFYLDSKLNRIDALASYSGRVGDTPGTNWLLVGTDARQGLSAAQQRELATGGDTGNARTDTIMLVHIPRSGAATLVSVPRDLYVEVPGQGSHKINAAFAFGGAQLLVQTFENASGVHIDHYAEIGFGGFASMVDALGGVELCPKQPINDPKAGLRLKAGCQTMNGPQALGYVRTRATPNADLDRVVHQREFLSALFKESTSPTTLINPFAVWGVASAAVSSLTVDNGTHLWHLARLAWALRGDTVTTTTPTAGSQWTSDGDSLGWGSNTTRFFGLLAADQPIPDDLLSGT